MRSGNANTLSLNSHTNHVTIFHLCCFSLLLLHLLWSPHSIRTHTIRLFAQYIVAATADALWHYRVSQPYFGQRAQTHTNTPKKNLQVSRPCHTATCISRITIYSLSWKSPLMTCSSSHVIVATWHFSTDERLNAKTFFLPLKRSTLHSVIPV